MPFEGTELTVFADDLDDSRDAFMNDAAQGPGRVTEIEGQKVAIFEESMEPDTWTIFVAFPRTGVVLIATNERFLQETLARIQWKERESTAG
ncbi:MAG: hypothetical protein WB795_21550 [Candidatus Acidiferrales bacterium]